MTRALDRLLAALFAALPDEPARARAVSRGVRDWDTLLARAAHQGVDGLLLWHGLAGDLVLPREQLAAAQRELAVRKLSQARLVACLDETHEALERAGVRAVALKGPVLAERLYPEPSLRRSSDVDVLVASRDLETAVRALEASGFVAPPFPGVEERSSPRCRTGDVHLERRELLVELHYRLYVAFGAVLPAEPFVERSVAHVTTRGRATRCLAPEDELLHLAVHAAGHGFERLAWLYDLKLLLRRHPSLDVAVVSERAHAAGMAEAFAFALWTLERVLGVRVLPGRSPVRSRVAGLFLRLGARRAYRAALSDRPLSVLLSAFDGPRALGGRRHAVGQR